MVKDKMLRLRRARFEFRAAEEDVHELLRERRIRANAMLQFNLLLGELSESTGSRASRMMGTTLAIVVATLAWKQGFHNTQLYTAVDGEEGMGRVVLRY